jgi:hypothetical protein
MLGQLRRLRYFRLAEVRLATTLVTAVGKANARDAPNGRTTAGARHRIERVRGR